jgi:hypothetical protein
MKEVKIELSQDEALVLFEFLSRYDERKNLDIKNGAEEKVLWMLHGAREKQLVQPFKLNYVELLLRSRQSVREKYGD